MAEISVESKVEFELECEKCDGELEGELRTTRYSGKQKLHVQPCKACLKEAQEEGVEQGKEEAGEESA